MTSKDLNLSTPGKCTLNPKCDILTFSLDQLKLVSLVMPSAGSFREQGVFHAGGMCVQEKCSIQQVWGLPIASLAFHSQALTRQSCADMPKLEITPVSTKHIMDKWILIYFSPTEVNGLPLHTLTWMNQRAVCSKTEYFCLKYYLRLCLTQKTPATGSKD
jgi:hypothetical protein